MRRWVGLVHAAACLDYGNVTGRALPKRYEEQAVLWLCRAFEGRHGLSAEACVDKAMNCLRMAALTASTNPPDNSQIATSLSLGAGQYATLDGPDIKD